MQTTLQATLDLQLVSQDFGGEVLIAIHDLRGAKVKSEILRGKNATISLHGLMPGYYFISLSSKEGVGTKKFIKL